MTDLITEAVSRRESPFVTTWVIVVRQPSTGAAVGSASVITVAHPSGWDDLMVKAATEMVAFLALNHLADDGRDRAELLIAGLDGNIAVIETVTTDELADNEADEVYQALEEWAVSEGVGLLTTMPTRWDVGRAEANADAVARNGFEQWGDTITWVSSPEGV